MVMLRRIVVLMVVIALAVAGYFMLKPTEEKRIKKRFNQLTGFLHKGAEESTLTSAGKAKAVSGLFMDSVRMTGAPHGLSGTYGAQELMGVVMQGRARFQSLDAEVHDLEITLVDEASATARFTGRLTGIVSGERAQEVREVRCGLTKLDGEWYIGGVEMIEVMRR